MYYILDGTIYQVPDFMEIVKSRALKISHYLKKSFELLQRGVGYNGSFGHQCWPQQSSGGTGSKIVIEKRLIREFPDFDVVMEDIQQYSTT